MLRCLWLCFGRLHYNYAYACTYVVVKRWLNHSTVIRPLLCVVCLHWLPALLHF